MTRQSKAVKERYWQELITRWESSGLSQQKFCAKQDIKYAQFLKWRGRLKQSKDSNPINFVNVEAIDSGDPKNKDGSIVIESKFYRIIFSTNISSELFMLTLQQINQLIC